MAFVLQCLAVPAPERGAVPLRWLVIETACAWFGLVLAYVGLRQFANLAHRNGSGLPMEIGLFFCLVFLIWMSVIAVLSALQFIG
jgi:hypothetical protein